jgi:hypothetical protein
MTETRLTFRDIRWWAPRVALVIAGFASAPASEDSAAIGSDLDEAPPPMVAAKVPPADTEEGSAAEMGTGTDEEEKPSSAGGTSPAAATTPPGKLGEASKATADSHDPALDPREAQAFRDAIQTLAESRDIGLLVESLGVLRRGFPRSRAILKECAGGPSAPARTFAVQILGEYGSADEDLPVAIEALKDSKVKVRLAGVMAVRRLGKEAKDVLPAFLEYLQREPEANNRKMAIKTLQDWRAKGAMPTLVRILESEKDKTVRNFAVSALQVLSRKELGDDAPAWRKYLEDDIDQEQVKELLEHAQKETSP